jgi:preprotein translocase subunit SecG
MSTPLIVLTLLFIVASVTLVLIILVQRPSGGGLSGAFGGAGGGGTDTAFGGRTGDVLTVATIAAFIVYLGLGVGLNIVDNVDDGGNAANAAEASIEGDGEVLEQDTPGEFLTPETAPTNPAIEIEGTTLKLNLGSGTTGGTTKKIDLVPSEPSKPKGP